MRIDPVLGMPSEVERPTTAGAGTAAATEINVHSNAGDAPVTAVAEVHEDTEAAPNGRGETVWLEKEKRQVYRVVDEKNGDVVCQVPSEEVLRVARNLEDLAKPERKRLDIKS